MRRLMPIPSELREHLREKVVPPGWNFWWRQITCALYHRWLSAWVGGGNK